MISTRTRWLLATATLFSGLLAGGILDRALVGAPAWQALGPETWALFSRNADLGRGLVAYPVEAIGAALLIIAATVSFHRDRAARRDVLTPLYLAVAFALTGLLLTMKAAPIMLSLGTDPQVSPAVAFARFNFWGIQLRGAADLLAFGFEIWSLVALSRSAGARYSRSGQSSLVPFTPYIEAPTVRAAAASHFR